MKNEYLSKITIGNTFLRLVFKDDSLYNYRRTIDIPQLVKITDAAPKVAQEHFDSDVRFNLKGQKVRNVSISFYRYNDKEVIHRVNYDVSLGLYGDHSYKGDAESISQSTPAPDSIVNMFIEIEQSNV